MKRTPLKRTSGLKRTTPIKRSGLRPGRRVHPDREGKVAFQRAAQQQLACMNPQCPNPAAPFNAHHVVYAQHVRREGGDVFDPRNVMRLCTECHDRYHGNRSLIPAEVLPPAAVAFAVELLGRERAAAYLARYYPA